MALFSRFARQPICLLFGLCFALSFLPAIISAQTTISTGSIVGTVTDPSGAVVPGAKVTISNRGTGEVVNITTTSAGTYNSGGSFPVNTRSRWKPRDFKPPWFQSRCRWESHRTVT